MLCGVRYSSFGVAFGLNASAHCAVLMATLEHNALAMVCKVRKIADGASM